MTKIGQGESAGLGSANLERQRTTTSAIPVAPASPAWSSSSFSDGARFHALSTREAGTGCAVRELGATSLSVPCATPSSGDSGSLPLPLAPPELLRSSSATCKGGELPEVIMTWPLCLSQDSQQGSQHLAVQVSGVDPAAAAHSVYVSIMVDAAPLATLDWSQELGAVAGQVPPCPTSSCTSPRTCLAVASAFAVNQCPQPSSQSPIARVGAPAASVAAAAASKLRVQGAHASNSSGKGGAALAPGRPSSTLGRHSVSLGCVPGPAMTLLFAPEPMSAELHRLFATLVERELLAHRPSGGYDGHRTGGSSGGGTGARTGLASSHTATSAQTAAGCEASAVWTGCAPATPHPGPHPITTPSSTTLSLAAAQHSGQGGSGRVVSVPPALDLSHVAAHTAAASDEACNRCAWSVSTAQVQTHALGSTTSAGLPRSAVTLDGIFASSPAAQRRSPTSSLRSHQSAGAPSCSPLLPIIHSPVEYGSGRLVAGSSAGAGAAVQGGPTCTRMNRQRSAGRCSLSDSGRRSTCDTLAPALSWQLVRELAHGGECAPPWCLSPAVGQAAEAVWARHIMPLVRDLAYLIQCVPGVFDHLRLSLCGRGTTWASGLSAAQHASLLANTWDRQTYCATMTRMTDLLQSHALWHTLSVVLTHAGEHCVYAHCRGLLLRGPGLAPTNLARLLTPRAGSAAREQITVSYHAQQPGPSQHRSGASSATAAAAEAFNLSVWFPRRHSEEGLGGDGILSCASSASDLVSLASRRSPRPLASGSAVADTQHAQHALGAAQPPSASRRSSWALLASVGEAALQSLQAMMPGDWSNSDAGTPATGGGPGGSRDSHARTSQGQVTPPAPTSGGGAAPQGSEGGALGGPGSGRPPRAVLARGSSVASLDATSAPTHCATSAPPSASSARFAPELHSAPCALVTPALTTALHEPAPCAAELQGTLDWPDVCEHRGDTGGPPHGVRVKHLDSEHDSAGAWLDLVPGRHATQRAWPSGTREQTTSDSGNGWRGVCCTGCVSGCGCGFNEGCDSCCHTGEGLAMNADKWDSATYRLLQSSNSINTSARSGGGGSNDTAAAAVAGGALHVPHTPALGLHVSVRRIPSMPGVGGSRPPTPGTTHYATFTYSSAPAKPPKPAPVSSALALAHLTGKDAARWHARMLAEQLALILVCMAVLLWNYL